MRQWNGFLRKCDAARFKLFSHFVESHVAGLSHISGRASSGRCDVSALGAARSIGGLAESGRDTANHQVPGHFLAINPLARSRLTCGQRLTPDCRSVSLSVRVCENSRKPTGVHCHAATLPVSAQGNRGCLPVGPGSSPQVQTAPNGGREALATERLIWSRLSTDLYVRCGRCHWLPQADGLRNRETGFLNVGVVDVDCRH